MYSSNNLLFYNVSLYFIFCLQFPFSFYF